MHFRAAKQSVASPRPLRKREKKEPLPLKNHLCDAAVIAALGWCSTALHGCTLLDGLPSQCKWQGIPHGHIEAAQEGGKAKVVCDDLHTLNDEAPDLWCVQQLQTCDKAACRKKYAFQTKDDFLNQRRQIAQNAPNYDNSRRLMGVRRRRTDNKSRQVARNLTEIPAVYQQLCRPVASCNSQIVAHGVVSLTLNGTQASVICDYGYHVDKLLGNLWCIPAPGGGYAFEIRRPVRGRQTSDGTGATATTTTTMATVVLNGARRPTSNSSATRSGSRSPAWNNSAARGKDQSKLFNGSAKTKRRLKLSNSSALNTSLMGMTNTALVATTSTRASDASSSSVAWHVFDVSTLGVCKAISDDVAPVVVDSMQKSFTLEELKDWDHAIGRDRQPASYQAWALAAMGLFVYMAVAATARQRVRQRQSPREWSPECANYEEGLIEEED